MDILCVYHHCSFLDRCTEMNFQICCHCCLSVLFLLMLLSSNNNQLLLHLFILITSSCRIFLVEYVFIWQDMQFSILFFLFKVLLSFSSFSIFYFFYFLFSVELSHPDIFSKRSFRLHLDQGFGGWKEKRKVDGYNSSDLIFFLSFSFASTNPSLSPWSKYNLRLCLGTWILNLYGLKSFIWIQFF